MLVPKPETLVLDHGILTAERGHPQGVLGLAAYPQVVPFVESIRAALAGDEAALERYFVTEFTGDLARWSLRFTPRDPAIARSFADVTLANLATVLAFGVLASSRLPMLADLGAVAAGAFLALLFSAMPSKPAAAEGGP
jgi:hypothetical protein